jgi:hypothetical protein
MNALLRQTRLLGDISIAIDRQPPNYHHRNRIWHIPLYLTRRDIIRDKQ